MQPTTPTTPKFFDSTSRAPTMAAEVSEVDTLEQLQTPEQVKLLDEIDELRKLCLGHYGINLPQLIVCGDQSSGKSSLLEGLTGLKFPAKESLGTTFATEVVSRRSTNVEITCTILPGKSRQKAQKHELSKFKLIFSSREDFKTPDVIQAAKKTMAFGDENKINSIFDDVLRISYSAPNIPSFTIVDLPGIVKTDPDNNVGGARKIQSLVASYMDDKNSIILAVVHSGTDPENQTILEYLNHFDPCGSRTMGIITKPDMVERGGDNEKQLMRLVRNERYQFEYRWHVVKNRKFATREQTNAERDESENKFFASGVWSSVSREDVGIATLRVKLAQMLLEHIGNELPSLVSAVQDSIAATQSRLKTLGSARETSGQQRQYLTEHAEKFQLLTDHALRGIYSSSFFALSATNGRTSTRLRTEIQNLNIAFAHIMYRKGHTWDIPHEQSSTISPFLLDVESSPAFQEYDARYEEPTEITRATYLEKNIGHHVRQSRPSGLHSIVNPGVIVGVFREQSEAWGGIAAFHLKRIFQTVKAYILEALNTLVDHRTCSMLMLKHIQPELDRRWSNVEAKLEELLLPYTEQDPITYDPNFVREIEQTRAARYGVANAQSGQQTLLMGSRSATQNLLTESLDAFTNTEILDLMQTYYKHALSVFINNVAVLAIENCLIKNLSAIFSPSLIASLSDAKLQAIAAESAEVQEERNSLQQRLSALQSGKDVLNEHLAMRPTVRTKTTTTPSFPTFHRDPRPVTPDSQRSWDGDLDHTKLKDVDGLSAQLNSLVVTPPPSDSERSHRKVDSAVATPTPTPKGSGKRVLSHAWPPSQSTPRQTVQQGSDDSDGEL
ncbi:P-loop containing nucleoside triphosphate hydrolase protein [Pyrenochaeta sp. MPI-SDFR-AT-0127]|nr:P-loop containing nucleoside triphosphate hydrolase protein [Pyrenochaeta sp. MPI-SDFR-AT-0127]